MRTVSAPELALLHNPIRSEGCKVEIIRHSNDAVVDITDIVQSIKISRSSDNRVATCSLEVQDPTVSCDTDGISPYLTASSYNTPDALFWPNNEIKVYAGLDDLGSTVSSFTMILIIYPKRWVLILW